MTNLTDLINFILPIVVIGPFLSLGFWIVGYILRMMNGTLEPDESKHITARPIQEMPKDQLEQVANVHHVINAKQPPLEVKDKDHCAYCGGKVKPVWYRCPNCGAPL